MQEADDLSDSASNGGGSKLPLIVAGLALILGAASLGLTLTSRSGSSSLADSLGAHGGRLESLESEMASLKTAVEDLKAQNEKTAANLRQLFNESQRALSEMSGEISRNSNKIKLIQETIVAMETRPEPTPEAVSSAGGSGGPAEDAPQDGVYAIQSGDTLAKVAKRFGVTLDALLQANPGVDPRRLQIGQKVVIP